ncbi:MAG: hypothetical protein ACYDIE_04410 [Candidatus Krumholzibacteriia bacterium]
MGRIRDDRRLRQPRFAAAALVGLLLILSAAPGNARLGWPAKKARAPHGAEKALPLRHAPRLEFLTGTLAHDRAGGWSLDGRRLTLREGFLVVGAGEDGRAAAPAGGQRVLLSGIRTARGFEAQSGVALSPEPLLATPRGEGARSVVWSASDPKVGVGKGPGRS